MIGVIADDLTGAAELGAVGLRHGLRAEVLSVNEPNRRVELVCIDTRSRSLPPAEAAARAAAAAKALRAAGAKWVYKKTDSVLRGQVTAEIAAIMAELGCKRALLLPANPSLGRTIRAGRYYINGRLINRTDFARDPEFPRRSASVLGLLARSGSFPIQVLKRSQQFSETGIHIGEVSSPAHTRSWVARFEPGMLLAGGAETFGAALRENGMKPVKLARSVAAPRNRREFFLCGSASDACREFVHDSRQRGVPVIGLPEELAWNSELSRVARSAVAERVCAALQTHPRVILAVGLPQIRDRLLARRLTGHLAELAEDILRDEPVEHVYAEGGETAAALLQRMGWVRLQVERELSPGVATLRPDGSRVRLTIKPGSYPWPLSVSGRTTRLKS